MADNYLERKFEEMEKMKKRHSGYGRYGRMPPFFASFAKISGDPFVPAALCRKYKRRA